MEWGGRLRTLETNIGVAPEHIAVEMRTELGKLAHQWDHQTGIDARTLGIATHAALVRIHPVVDGNGRATRVLADLVFLAAQTDWEPLRTYDWEFDREEYIARRREYDATRHPRALAELVPVVSIEQ